MRNTGHETVGPLLKILNEITKTMSNICNDVPLNANLCNLIKMTLNCNREKLKPFKTSK